MAQPGGLAKLRFRAAIISSNVDPGLGKVG